MRPFDFLGELDVGNDEAEIVLGLQQDADAGVADDRGQGEAEKIDQLRIGLGDPRAEGEQKHVGQKQADDHAEVDGGDRVEPLAADGHVGDEHAGGDRQHAEEADPGEPAVFADQQIGAEQLKAERNGHREKHAA